MTSEIDTIIAKAMTLNPSERALVAHCLISSIDQPADEEVDKSWLDLAEKRISELENQHIKPLTWDELKKQIRKK